MYNPNVPSSNMGIAPVSSAPSQPLGPTPMGPPPPMMGGMPPPPMGAPMGPPPISPTTEGLGGFGGSRAGRAGFSERMQKMTAPPKPKPQPQQMQQPVQGMSYGGMVRSMLPFDRGASVPSFGQLSGQMPYRPQRDVSNSALSKSGGGIDQYGEYLEQTYGDPDFDQKRDDFLKNVSQQEQQTFGGGGGGGGGGGMGGKIGGIGFFAPQVMNQPFMGGASQQGFPSYGIHRQGAFNSSPFGRHTLFKDGGEVPRDVNPVDMALGGFIGNENTRDYGDDRYTDPYEELDDIYEDDGGYDPTDPYDDGDDGDDNGPAADLVYGGGGGGRNVEQPVGPNNAQEALDQANADFKAGRGDIADLDLAALSSRISRGSDVMPASLESIDAISRNFAVPAPTDTTFSDPDEIFDLSNPISLNTAQVVGPNPRTDASGNLVPGRSNTAADIEAGTLSARNLGPEVMSFDPASPGDMRNVNVGQSPVTSGMADKPVVGTNFPPAGSSPPSYGDLSVSNAAPPAPKMALPDGSARASIEDGGLANAMAAAQAGSNEINALGSDAYTGIFEPEFVEPTPAEIQASNRRAMAEARADDASGRRVDVDPDGQAFGTMGSYDGLTIPQSPRAAGSEFAASDAQSLQNTINRLSSGREAPDVSKATEIEIARLISQSEPVLAPPTGKLMFEGGPDFTARRAGEILDSLNMGGGKGAISPSPAPAVIRPQNTKYLSPFDISELENAARDYRETGAGSSDYDPMAAQATAEALKRAEDDVSALDRIAEARMPTDDMQIVPTAPAQPVPADPSVVPASFTNVDPYEDQSVKDSYYDQLFGDSPKAVQLLGSTLNFLSGGLIDINKLNEDQRKKGLEAFAKTNELAYENGVVVGVKDPKGNTIRLGPQPPKERNDTGGDDGCPSGFRRVNGVCQPIDGVSANPADDIADDIEKATMPIIRPLDPPTGDVPTDPVANDPSGIDFRRPNYFAGGGAVSDGMGSAIDNFISAMSR